ncbi:MAG: hypothetical protein JRC86_06210 [Deltaproteobacteria bacterium]|nr:hypothetical protein [Deltaproteobacteria bacterium]
MSGTVNKMGEWFSMDEEVTHFCGGSTEDVKVNKPKGTQTEKTKWFNPAPKEDDSDTNKCTACGAERQDDEKIIQVGS